MYDLLKLAQLIKKLIESDIIPSSKSSTHDPELHNERKQIKKAMSHLYDEPNKGEKHSTGGWVERINKEKQKNTRGNNQDRER